MLELESKGRCSSAALPYPSCYKSSDKPTSDKLNLYSASPVLGCGYHILRATDIQYPTTIFHFALEISSVKLLHQCGLNSQENSFDLKPFTLLNMTVQASPRGNPL